MTNRERARAVIIDMARVIAEDIGRPLDGIHVTLLDEQIDIIAAALDEAEARGAARELSLVVAWFREVYDGTFEQIVFERIVASLETREHAQNGGGDAT